MPRRSFTDESGRNTTGVQFVHNGKSIVVDARRVIIMRRCQLCRSVAPVPPRTSTPMANSSGMVGRNYMVHNDSIIVLQPKRNKVEFQKTLSSTTTTPKRNQALPTGPRPADPESSRAPCRWDKKPLIPKSALNEAARHSMDWWLFPKTCLTRRTESRCETTMPSRLIGSQQCRSPSASGEGNEARPPENGLPADLQRNHWDCRQLAPSRNRARAGEDPGHPYSIRTAGRTM